ncbi:DNA circularization protein [Azotobacter bryophylli]|uniref:DNA circularization protein n=1 Tax=Azotobacter bryophylli TaxID=1986537 RepID=A0ABV7AXM6_9GAMM
MAWRDEYRPGAFRGVPFHLKNSSSTGGRRTVLNEFPLRDTPDTEDMGRRARQFSLTMTLIGSDYMDQRDRLIEALETSGPGTLMHPFRGELRVAVLGDYSCEESTEQGGMARVSVTFVESGETPRPDSVVVQGFAGNEAADALEEDALSEFLDKFAVVGWVSSVAEEAQGMLGEAMSAVTDAVGYAEGLAGDAIGFAQNAAGKIMSGGGLLQGAGSFGTLMRRLTGSAQQLILSPGNLGGALLGMVRSISLGTGSPLQALRAQMSLFGLGSRAKSVSHSSRAGYQTPARAQMATNQAAVYTLIERAAVAEAVRLAVSKPASSPASSLASTSTAATTAGQIPSTVAISGGQWLATGAASLAVATGATPHRVNGVAFDNRDQAVEIRDQLLEELDRQQLTAAPERYRPLARLSTELIAEMNRTAASLVPLAHVTPTKTQPALLLAHRLYGDARQAEQIVTRNRIAHPGFVPGGIELEVLKNA